MNSTSTNLITTNYTSTNFIHIVLKFILVEFVLVETVLVGDPLYLELDLYMGSALNDKQCLNDLSLDHI